MGKDLPKVHTRGFASMTPERRREIASKAGKAAQAKGTAHEWTSEEAQVAGRKSRRRLKITDEVQREIDNAASLFLMWSFGAQWQRGDV